MHEELLENGLIHQKGNRYQMLRLLFGELFSGEVARRDLKGCRCEKQIRKLLSHRDRYHWSRDLQELRLGCKGLFGGGELLGARQS